MASKFEFETENDGNEKINRQMKNGLRIGKIIDVTIQSILEDFIKSNNYYDWEVELPKPLHWRARRKRKDTTTRSQDENVNVILSVDDQGLVLSVGFGYLTPSNTENAMKLCEVLHEETDFKVVKYKESKPLKERLLFGGLVEEEYWIQEPW